MGNIKYCLAEHVEGFDTMRHTQTAFNTIHFSYSYFL